MLRSPTVPCPVCTFPITRDLIGREAFHCPRCGEVLQVDNRLAVPVAILCVPLAALLSYLAGASGIALVLVAAVLYFPICAALGFVDGLLRFNLIRSKSPYDEVFPHVTPPTEAPKGEHTESSG